MKTLVLEAKKPKNYSFYTIYQHFKKKNKMPEWWITLGIFIHLIVWFISFPFAGATLKSTYLFGEKVNFQAGWSPGSSGAFFCHLKVKFFSETIAGVSVLPSNSCRSCLTFVSASQYSHCWKKHCGELSSQSQGEVLCHRQLLTSEDKLVKGQIKLF